MVIRSLKSNTTALVILVAVGKGALESNTTANNGCTHASVLRALNANTTGANNTADGSEMLSTVNTTGGNNVALGEHLP